MRIAPAPTGGALRCGEANRRRFRCRAEPDPTPRPPPSDSLTFSPVVPRQPRPALRTPSPPTDPSPNLKIPRKRILKTGALDGEVSPVFRFSPYDAEQRRKKRGNQQAHILFLDEGNDCRSLLGVAILTSLAQSAPFYKQLCISSASIGPMSNAIETSQLIQITQEMGLGLTEAALQQSGHVFEQERDPIDSDLILVMDRFDHEEVYKDISVLDAINPNGYYTSRLKLLGEFCRTLGMHNDLLDVMEISDPWYGTLTPEERTNALKIAGRKMLQGCRGLFMYLSLLHHRCLHGLPLQTALIQSLRCPVMEQSSLARNARMRTWKPVWRTNETKSGRFYTLRDVGGDWCIVRKSMNPRKTKNYWKDLVNVENELRCWMRKHKSLHRLPKHRELKETGYFSLSSAVLYHGGISAFETRLHAPSYAKRRKPRSYWEAIENVEKELKMWMDEYGADTFPTRQMLRETGHNALASALRLHGGLEAMSRRLELTGRQKGRHFWEDDQNFKHEVLPYLTEGKDGWLYLPTQKSLRDAQRADLLGAILRRGGLKKVAEAFGWRHHRMLRSS